MNTRISVFVAILLPVMAVPARSAESRSVRKTLPVNAPFGVRVVRPTYVEQQ